DKAERMDTEHFPGQARQPQLAQHLSTRERRICSYHCSVEGADADADQPARRLHAGLKEPQQRANLGGASCAASPKDPGPLWPAPAYVPSSQELKYFTCSSVRESMDTPIAASFNRATWASISLGTS